MTAASAGDGPTAPHVATEADLRSRIAELEASLDAARSELEDRKQFVAQVMEAEDRARRRIAQLIHDDALQNLLAANQDLIEAAPGRVGVTRAHEVVNATIEHLREAMLALHPVTLERGGLEQALAAIARQAERQGNLTVEIDLDPRAMGQNDELFLALSRELLANAARHAQARKVEVKILAGDGQLTLEVVDDGRGMDADRSRQALQEGHIGLASVAQRLEACGGRFELTSAPGEGTRALVTVPD